MALGVPGFGAVSASLLADFGASFRLTFVNYRQVFESSGLSGPRSLAYGAITASIAVVGRFAFATMLAKKRTKSTRLLDVLLLASVALPSVVFAAGYIFACSLPVLSRIGIDIYQTVTILVLGYLASSLPTNVRVLVGAVSQVQRSLHEAGRAHGASGIGAWVRGGFPILYRPLTTAWCSPSRVSSSSWRSTASRSRSSRGRCSSCWVRPARARRRCSDASPASSG
ncbi:MAG: ABC transporter permease subunit [Acidimicrobiales bacterium]